VPPERALVAVKKPVPIRSALAWTFAVTSVLALVRDEMGPIRPWPKMVFWTSFAAYNVLDPSATFGRRWFWIIVWMVWAGITVYGMTNCCS
jgi:hypothetical protein